MGDRRTSIHVANKSVISKFQTMVILNYLYFSSSVAIIICTNKSMIIIIYQPGMSRRDLLLSKTMSSKSSGGVITLDANEVRYRTAVHIAFI